MTPSDDNLARTVLAALQNAAYRSAGEDYPRDRDPERKLEFVQSHPLTSGIVSDPEMLEGLRLYYAEFMKRLPTTEQSISNYENILQRYYLLMFKFDAVSPKGLVRPRPVLGTLPLGRVNGCVMRAEGIEVPIVMLDDGVFAFAHLSAKIVAPYLASLAHPTPDGAGLVWPGVLDLSGVPKTLTPASVHRSVELFNAFLVHGNPYKAPYYVADKPWANIAAFIRDAGELFIVAHELGHIAKGHKGGAAALPRDLGTCPPDETVFDWDDEYAADLFASELALGAMSDQGYPLAMAFAAMDVFLTWLQLVERSVTLLKYGRKGTCFFRSHPPTAARRAALRDVFFRSVPSERRDAILILGVLDAITTALFAHVEKHILHLRREGVLGHAIWAHFDTGFEDD